ncbi:hypothetical protein Pfo_023268 [Paulownia fortunei]|nr:hypothetical protein Pfo_023268 [Paulownia fortunei]
MTFVKKKNRKKNSHQKVSGYHTKMNLAKFFIDYEQKLEDVRHLLKSSEEEDPVESLIFVDAIQRLGVGHHYQEEIHTILTQHYVKTSGRIYGYCSLHDVALSFRLLRQRGFHVSADAFNNFKGKDGRFKGKLRQDIRGLLELYEATQVSFEGENIFDEAADFSSQLLHECLADMDYKLSNIVNMRLRHPYHKSITRLAEKNFLRDLGSMNGWRKTLGELVEMDFLMGQSIYQEEFLQVSKWWDGLGLTRELKLARNQPLKWCTWAMAILSNDISLSVQRVQLTKSIAFIYLIDDIFDLYGTPDELAIFTEAVNKWDYASIDMLPDYMKMCYKALLYTTNEIGHVICEKHGYNPIDSLKQTWASLCNAFLVEAKWFASRDLPRAEEYLANGKVSSGVHVVLVHLFFLLGLGGTNEGTIHLNDTSTLISCVAAILRLWDDLGSAKDEHQNGKDGSYIECYMKDHHGLPFKQAKEHVRNMIASEWKRLNKECFHLNHTSASPFQEASLNLARMVPLMYSYDDNQRLPILEEYVNFMLFNQTSSEHHQTKQEQVV